MTRTLFIHAGGYKTGSSAIQNQLARGAVRLAAHGVDYIDDVGVTSAFTITSGNAARLASMLVDDVVDWSSVDAECGAFFRDNPTAVCSSELLGMVAASRWAELGERLQRHGIVAEVIVFVRDLVPFLLSGYDQRIKRHGLSLGVEEALAGITSMPQVHLLRLLDGLRPLYRLKVVHYDSVAADATAALLECIGIRDETISGSERVNRSLTTAEREVLTLVNAHFGEKYSTEVSDLLLYARPDAPPEQPTISDSTIARLRRDCQPDVDWINTNFFGGRPVVTLGDRARRVPSANTDSGAAAHRTALMWALQKMQAAEQS